MARKIFGILAVTAQGSSIDAISWTAAASTSDATGGSACSSSSIQLAVSTPAPSYSGNDTYEPNPLCGYVNYNSGG
jgi:hypothetical protein